MNKLFNRLPLALTAIAAVALTGCASFDKTPEGYANLVYTKTDYNPTLSYAYNILFDMMDLKGSGFRYEVAPLKSGVNDKAPEGYLDDKACPAPEEATESWGFVPVETQIIKTTERGNQKAALALKSASIGADLIGSSAGTLLDLASDLFGRDSTKVTEVEPTRSPRHDYLSDQFHAFMRKSDFEDVNAVENFMYDTLKAAFEKGGSEVVKGGVTVAVERGCEHTKITGQLNDKAKTVWMELYLARFYGTNSEVVPKCEHTAGYKSGETVNLPIYMWKQVDGIQLFHLGTGIAWTYSNKTGTHLFLKGKGASIAAKAAKYFPENAFIYIAPRQVNGQLKAPYLLDQYGRHEFGQPAQNTIPAWYSWISEKYPDTEYRN